MRNAAAGWTLAEPAVRGCPFSQPAAVLGCVEVRGVATAASPASGSLPPHWPGSLATGSAGSSCARALAGPVQWGNLDEDDAGEDQGATGDSSCMQPLAHQQVAK